MSDDLVELVICGQQKSYSSFKLRPPLTTGFTFNLEEFIEYIKPKPKNKSVRFIVIFLDVFGHTLDSLLSSIGDITNIIGIYIGDNKIQNLEYNRPKIFHRPRRNITFSITLHAIHACQSASQNLFASNNKGDAIVWEQKANDLRGWLTTNSKIETCDILIIPLYTANDNLWLYQAELIEICNDLFKDSKTRVCTLDDYICPVESYPNMSKEEMSFITEENKKICSLLQEKSGPRRIYLFGNDELMSNEWSILMCNNEEFNFNENGPQYGDSFTFAEYESVTRGTIAKLNGYDGNLGRVTKSMLKRLGEIENAPIYFFCVLEDVRNKFEERETAANRMLSQLKMNYRDKCTIYSERFYTTEQAQNGPIREDDVLTHEMDRMIQSPAP
ncbi:unnamed protein product, partial [Adineta steineri]